MRTPLIAMVVGTRPEAIKMAPLCQAMATDSRLQFSLISTGQHRSQLDQVFERFNLTPDIDLDLMNKTSNLNELSGRVLQEMDGILENVSPDMLLVQGDTTTAFAAGLAAFQKGIPVGHVEAGLRSGDIMNPYPEEANRRFISLFASLNFAPTEHARQKLLAENVRDDIIVVTGNTVVDALNTIAGRITGLPESVKRLVTLGRRLILVTAHRRESWGKPMEHICRAIDTIVTTFPATEVVFPVHKNPAVRDVVFPILAGHERIHLIEPLDYFDFISTMKYADLVLSDSGGVQEEAPTFETPVLIMRENTERPEVFDTGKAALVGTDTEEIIRQATRHLAWDGGHSAWKTGNPFGDGKASERIVKAILAWHEGKKPYLTPQESFSPNTTITTK
ncbi:non-hydrolyzing UDP-N-acetylglucosamine 2-epimerase [Desulfoplanes formicivorans]|uniref:UDP-N-acetylglucosamine 2-epimerase (non-hydrolyzing) n=1 Tax=Desulfoplanes formicivorans TaxID=1592317 RepID=A0A194AL32_9BACT|nr:UDP-N-acetylglucosamine 2-epimerase (non-hydrolyzing) [Desulfoplanes formicivorans]GAU09751.1 UDP-N-acetylglucosamine 2-epimerase [Desulfoplanes formicivorans]